MDASTELQYNRARYYVPAVGRWASETRQDSRRETVTYTDTRPTLR